MGQLQTLCSQNNTYISHLLSTYLSTYCIRKILSTSMMQRMVRGARALYKPSALGV